MHIFRLRRLVAFLGLWSIVTYALSIPQGHVDNKVLRDVTNIDANGEFEPVAVLLGNPATRGLQARAKPKTSAKPKPPPSATPSTSAKPSPSATPSTSSKPTSTPKATSTVKISASSTQGASASGAPKVSGTSKATNSTSPTGTAKGSNKPTNTPKPTGTPSSNPSPSPSPRPSPSPSPSPGPTPTPGSSVEFPKLSVPYQNEAHNLCLFYLDCPEDDEDDESSLERRRVYRDNHLLSKRRKVGPWNVPNHPKSGQLYKAPRDKNPKHILHFANNNLDNDAIKDDNDLTKIATSEYATEHILELQTMVMFNKELEKKDAKKWEPFWNDEFDKERDEAHVKGRPSKPSYFEEQEKKGTTPRRVKFSQIVFDAFGTTINLSNLLLLQKEINSFKERVWSFKDPMEEDKFKGAYEDASTGARPSSHYLSVIRMVFGVFNYMNTPIVSGNLRKINNDVKLELGNAGYVTKDAKLDLVTPWNPFLTAHFDELEKRSRDWLKNKIELVLVDLRAALTKYNTMLDELEKKEDAKQNKQIQKYKDDQAAKEKTLQAQHSQDESKVREVEQEIKDLKEKKNLSSSARDSEKLRLGKKLLKAMQTAGRTQRSIHELYSSSVKDIIKNLKKDETLLLAWQKRVPGLKMPRP
ncbi:hypothetical protein CC80DRAFT_589225 [Byssothecium circinans]|uniref:Uncharacterized protein n=1 Tax=Byssothecium circinans TaxID=147558 RepID=A0A6A5U967_9PLEO|nr:hypothetical protein CC80DRAFT_589225 [Byssothecium circinans]